MGVEWAGWLWGGCGVAVVGVAVGWLGGSGRKVGPRDKQIATRKKGRVAVSEGG